MSAKLETLSNIHEIVRALRHIKYGLSEEANIRRRIKKMVQQGMTYRGIGDVLGLSPGQVRDRYMQWIYDEQ